VVLLRKSIPQKTNLQTAAELSVLTKRKGVRVKWSYSRSLAESKVVKSSYVWLFIVPIAARMMSSLDDVIDLTIFGGSIQIATTLPFSWQLLFMAACFFTVANIIYSLFCPEIFKEYRSYSEFRDDSKTLLQIHSAIKNMVWSNKKPGVKSNYIKHLSSYFKHYCASPNMEERDLDLNGRALFDNMELANRANISNNAFYFCQTLANEHNQPAVISTLLCYGVGLLFIGMIAIQNIAYVLQTFG
jgi:hypothetical protein